MANQFFYKTFFDFGIYSVSDLLFNLSNIESFNEISKKVKSVNFLTWSGLRHAIPPNLKKKICGPTIGDSSLKHNGNILDITKNISKDYYSLIICEKAQLPNNAHKLKHDFTLSEDDLKLACTLPHTVALEPYVQAFQYKVLIRYFIQTQNYTKLATLNKINALFAIQHLKHYTTFPFYCPHSNLFWKDCEQYAFTITKQKRVLNV